MARTRNIKPGFFMNDKLAELPALTRIIFAGLPCIADKSGRLEDRPKRIKAMLLPYDDFDVNDALDALNDAGFIIRYSVGENQYIQIDTFEKHQSPHMKEPESTIPAPDKHRTSTGPAPVEPPLNPSSLTLNPSNTSTATRFDDFWAAYPKKVEKKKALEIWKRRKLDSLADSLIADVRGRMERDRKWIDGYIPNPTTYLNGDRWEDEMGAAALSLPKDPKALFAIRRAIGLPFEFDEVKSCHAEIQGAVRADPAKRQAVEALL